MDESFAYVLNRRSYRDSSLLLDIFSEDFGRFCCIARPAKKRGKVVKGHTEPFRYLHMQWIGRGEVKTITEADERGRHTIPSSELMLGLYINELIMLFTQQYQPQKELFNAYKYTLHKLGDAQINRHIMMRFELYLLQNLDYSISADLSLSQLKDLVESKRFFSFTKNEGLFLEELDQMDVSPYKRTNHQQKVLISAELLLALKDIQNMQESQWRELRSFLDKVFVILSSRPINSRKLLSL